MYISEEDYLLGIAGELASLIVCFRNGDQQQNEHFLFPEDLSGELMRKAISLVSAGDTAYACTICQFLQAMLHGISKSRHPLFLSALPLPCASQLYLLSLFPLSALFLSPVPQSPWHTTAKAFYKHYLSLSLSHTPTHSPPSALCPRSFPVLYSLFSALLLCFSKNVM